MFNNNTDREWEKIGKNDPYFGVITHDKYHKSNLTDENIKDFFNSGYIYIDNVLKNIRQYIDPAYNIRHALDFGCGVGRLVIPLAKVAENVTGIDFSDSMLSEAEKNCEAQMIKNVSFIKSDDNLSLLNGKYDLINSCAVFQHIPVKRGLRIFKNLLAHLEDGGVCVVHFTYAKNYKVRKLVPFVKNYVPLAKNIINLIKGREFFAPQIQMNTYNLNELFFLIQKFNVQEFHSEYTNHRDELGIIVYFKKQEKI